MFAKGECVKFKTEPELLITILHYSSLAFQIGL